MAIKRTDNPKYKDPNRIAVHFKHARLGILPYAIKIGTLGVAASVAYGTYQVLDGTAPLPEIDNNLNAGIFNQAQRYSYYDWERNGALNGYMIIEHDEGYALYENMETQQRFKFVEDEALALIHIDATMGNLQMALNETISEAAIEDPFVTAGTSRLYECSYISLPYSYNGGVERYLGQSDEGYRGECGSLAGTNTERQEILNTHLAMWQNARDAISTQSGQYGIDADRMTDASVESHAEIFAENVGKTLTGGALLWLLSTGLGAYRRQRQHTKPRTP